MRTTFVVGRLTTKSAEIVVVDDSRRPPFPGPFLLKALVRPGPRDWHRPLKATELAH